MAGQPPSPQGAPQQGAPGQQPQPQIPPELLMVLLSHLAQGGGQTGQQGSSPPPKDGSQTPSLADLLPGLLQSLMGQQQPPGAQTPGAQQGQPPQAQQKPGAQPQQG